MFQMLCHDCFSLWTSRNLLLEANFRLCSAFLSLAMRSTSKHDSFYPKANLFPFPSWWGPKYQFPETFYLFLQMKLSKYSTEFVRNSSLSQRSVLTNVTCWLCVFSWLGRVALSVAGCSCIVGTHCDTTFVSLLPSSWKYTLKSNVQISTLYTLLIYRTPNSTLKEALKKIRLTLKSLHSNLEL